MKIGIAAYGISAIDFVNLALTADQLGFDSLWIAEHVLYPNDYSSNHPGNDKMRVVTRESELNDPMLLLAAAAAVTHRISLVTGIYLAALRSPLLTARAALTLQSLSGGRFVLGVAAGWLKEEFDALGVSFEKRGALLDEAISVLETVCAGGAGSFSGNHSAFEGVALTPRAVHVPLVVGGHSNAALKRAALKADGWFSSGSPSLDEAIELRKRLNVYRTRLNPGRPLTAYVRIAGSEVATIEKYLQAGFDHIVVWANEVWPAGGDIAARQEHLSEFAESLAPLRSSRSRILT